MSYPCLKINLSGIAANSKLINDRCIRSGISVVGVLKCVLGDNIIADILKQQGIGIIGDSRLNNLRKLRDHFGKGQQLIMLRTPMISELEDLTEICDTSMNTQKETIGILSKICSKKGLKHNIVIMVETDDRREGLSPQEVLPFCEYIIKNCTNIKILGLGTNARCISTKAPRPESLKILVRLKNEIEDKYAIKIPVVSGGNSSIWDLIENGHIPAGINQVRIGEAILLGHETAGYRPIKGASNKTFSLEAEIIEIKSKNDKIYKIIIALGIQDVSAKNIYSSNPGLEVLDQSSDHTVLGLKKDAIFKTGDIIDFQLNYFGLLSCMTSPFIEKVYIEA